VPNRHSQRQPLRLSGLLSFYLMEKIDTTTKTLMPVFNQTGCCGHILRTAKGFKACDANDKEIGVSETPAAVRYWRPLRTRLSCALPGRFPGAICWEARPDKESVAH
jgi:hypothetical protein